MLESLKKNLAILRAGKAGSRFQEFRRYKRQQPGGNSATSRIVTFVFGILLIVLGAAIGWLPGPGGFVAFIGLAMLGREIPWIPRVMDSIELFSRQMYERFRQLPVWIQVALVLGMVISAMTATWIGINWFF